MKKSDLNLLKSLLKFEAPYFARYKSNSEIVEISLDKSKNIGDFWVANTAHRKMSEVNGSSGSNFPLNTKVAGTYAYCLSEIKEVELGLLDSGFEKEEDSDF